MRGRFCFFLNKFIFKHTLPFDFIPNAISNQSKAFMYNAGNRNIKLNRVSEDSTVTFLQSVLITVREIAIQKNALILAPNT